METIEKKDDFSIKIFIDGPYVNPPPLGFERVLGGELAVLLLPTLSEAEWEEAAGSGVNFCRISNLKWASLQCLRAWIAHSLRIRGHGL